MFSVVIDGFLMIFQPIELLFCQQHLQLPVIYERIVVRVQHRLSDKYIIVTLLLLRTVRLRPTFFFFFFHSFSSLW